MEETKVKKQRKIGRWEIFWISFEGLAAFVGLFLMILGIVGDYLPVRYKYNWILQSETGWMKFSGSQITFRWFGFFFLIGAAILAVITLNYFAKAGDRNEERALRRAQRLQVLSSSQEETPETKTEAAVEVPSTPVSKPDTPNK
jgi:hypothetical protein